LWRWGAQAEIDGGEAPGVTIEENEEIRRLREDVAILKAATTFFVGELAPPQRLAVALIGEHRSPDGSDRPG